MVVLKDEADKIASVRLVVALAKALQGMAEANDIAPVEAV